MCERLLLEGFFPWDLSRLTCWREYNGTVGGLIVARNTLLWRKDSSSQNSPRNICKESVFSGRKVRKSFGCEVRPSVKNREYFDWGVENTSFWSEVLKQKSKLIGLCQYLSNSTTTNHKLLSKVWLQINQFWVNIWLWRKFWSVYVGKAVQNVENFWGLDPMMQL